MAKDYYKILGVSKSATGEEVKKAYRKLAHQYHPDKKGGDEAKFKEVNEAYQVLGDEKKRAQYDQFGSDFAGFSASGGPGAGVNWGGFGNMGGFPGGMNGQYVDLGDLGDIFETFFGGMGGARPKRRTYQQGSDLELAEEITLEEAYRGITKHLQFKTLVVCAACKGQGGDPKAGMETCSVCNGRGEIREERRTFFGSFSQVKTCEKCNGRGELPKKICEICKGKGRVTGERRADIEILPGIQSNQIIQIRGMGEAGEHGSAAGDLYVRVKVKPHAVFERRGDDLVVKHDLKLTDILLGKTVSVPTIEGATAEFEIPANYDLKQPFRIGGKGMPRFGSFGKGDLLVDFIIKAPKKLSDKAKKLLEELED